MIQSRAQFGFYGAIVPLVLVLLMYVGYFAASAILVARPSRRVVGHHEKLATSSFPCCARCSRSMLPLIHQYERWNQPHQRARLRLPHHPATHLATTSARCGSREAFLTVRSFWASPWLPHGRSHMRLTWADYSRYLPEDTKMSATFLVDRSGLGYRLVLLMGFGAVGLAVAPKCSTRERDLLHGPGQQPHGLWLIALIIIGGIVAANVLNLYGMFMSSTTTVTALRRMQVNRGARTIFVLVAAVVGTVLAIAATSNFLDNFENFILFWRTS